VAIGLGSRDCNSPAEVAGRVTLVEKFNDSKVGFSELINTIRSANSWRQAVRQRLLGVKSSASCQCSTLPCMVSHIILRIVELGGALIIEVVCGVLDTGLITEGGLVTDQTRLVEPTTPELELFSMNATPALP
jgi:hypothetical protein